MIKSRRLRWANHLVRIEESRTGFKIFTAIPTGKRPLRRFKRRLQDNIRMPLKEIGINMRNWDDSPQDTDY